jgi:GT2 family glycosyltransferase
MNLNLSICVVTYNSEAYIERFHRELSASLLPHESWELLYFDNSPTGASAQLLRAGAQSSVRVLEDRENRGFSYANNRLIELSRHGNVLLLNPDVFGFTAEFWPALMQRAAADSVRFIKLLNTDGTFQDCVGRVSSLGRAFSASADYAAITEPQAVEMGIMAFMFTTRAVLDRVGKLDEAYSLYCEDMDWCYRASRMGVKLVYDPGLALTHVGGASSDSLWNRKTARQRKYAAERIFIKKHYRGPHALAMLLLNQLKQLRAAL